MKECKLPKERLDFTDYAPDPDLENEYYGGFRPTTKEFGARTRAEGLYCSEGEFSRSGRGPKGWADDRLWGLVDGHTPEFYDFLKACGRWPKWRKVKPRRATSNRIIFPFALQAIRQAEQGLPEVNPERDAAEDLDRRMRRLEALADRGIEPDDRPFTPHNILHGERAQLYAQHTERRIQAALYRGFKPSKKLDAKRLPTLKRVAPNPLLTKQYLGRGLRSVKDAQRAECEVLVARFLEKREVEQTKVSTERRKSGRKPIHAIAMTSAERVRRHRRNKRLQALIAPSAAPTAGQPLPQGKPAVTLSETTTHELATADGSNLSRHQRAHSRHRA